MRGDEKDEMKRRRGNTYGRGKSFAGQKSWSLVVVVVVV